MGRLATLVALYFSQGLPFGFQVTALPLLLRERGVSLQAIGFASLLSAPWLAKALWAPWVDRYGHRGFGRRKTWIVPMQLGLTACALLAGRTERVEMLLWLAFAMNLFAATQDIAVDALAVSWIEPRELGLINALQVVGYKLGMLTGGGLLLWASARIGYNGMFDAMAVLMLLVVVVALRMREPDSEPEPEPSIEVGRAERAPDDGRDAHEARSDGSLRGVWLQLVAVMRAPAAVPLVLVIITYKMGEALADAMWKPLLFDRGFAAADVGLWNGTYGMLASFAGSFLAGMWARTRPLPAALAEISLLRAGGVAAEWWLSVAEVSPARVIAVTCVEHFLGGAITTVLFALMMRHTRREIGATHYTLLASLEVWGKLPPGAMSGVLAQRAGYPAVFGLATLLSVAFAMFALRVRAPLLAAVSDTRRRSP